MRGTAVWKRDAQLVEDTLSTMWPSRVSIESPPAEKQVYVAMEARIGRRLLEKKHETFIEFDSFTDIYTRFDTELNDVRAGKPPPNLIADKVKVAEAATSGASGSIGSVRFGKDGKAVDQGILLQETGLLPGTYLKSKLPKPQPRREGTLLPILLFF